MRDKEMKKRIVIGVSGASGAPLAELLLRELKKIDDVESHLVVTYGGERTIEEECGISVDELKSMANVVYNNNNIGASIASGTFETLGMIICPCSMKTLAGIANGFSDNLLLRAADVCMKEQRKLVLAVRESPLSKVHLDNMSYLSGIPGVFIQPPVVGYYHHPKELVSMERQIVGKLLDRFQVETCLERWN